jgi:hypothetical protein
MFCFVSFELGVVGVQPKIGRDYILQNAQKTITEYWYLLVYWYVNDFNVVVAQDSWKNQ